MNIALVIERLEGGGAEAVVESLARHLHNSGRARVTVHCLRSGGPRGERLKSDGVPIREYHAGKGDLGLLVRLALNLRRDHAGLVNAHSSAAYIRALPACAVLGIPLVRTLHGALLGPPTRDRALADRLGGWAAATIAVAEAALPRRHSGLRRARVIHNGISLPPPDRAAAAVMLRERLGAPLPRPVVLAIGAVCPEKDAVTLVTAFARVREQFPAARLIHAGPVRDVAHQRRAVECARAIGCADAIHWLGPIDDAWRLLAAADVFCLSSRREATPLVVLEAMSQRCPIVATRVGDVGHTLHDGREARLVEPGDPAALAAALTAALRDPAESRRLADSACARFDRSFSAERMAGEYAQLFQTVCTSRAARGEGPCSRGRSSSRGSAPRRLDVLMVGPARPAVGGMVTAADGIAGGPLATRRRLARFASTPESRLGNEPRNSWLPWNWRGVNALKRHGGNAVRLATDLARLRPRIVHIHTCSGFSFVRSVLDGLLARAFGGRVVFHIHGGRFADFSTSGGIARRVLMRVSDRIASAFIVVDPRTGEALRTAGGRAVHCVPNAVTVPQPSSTPGRPKRGPCRFLYLGALTDAKGIPELLDAAGKLVNAAVPFELRMIGPDPRKMRKQYEAQLASVDHVGRVSFADPISPAARDDLLSASDCLVLPSHSEAMPMCVLEAAAAGLAVIATRVGQMPEIARQFDFESELRAYSFEGALVAPRAADALAAEMKRMATDRSLRMAFGTALRDFVTEHYSLERQAAALDEIYRMVLGERPARTKPIAPRRSAPPHETNAGAQSAEVPVLVECR